VVPERTFQDQLVARIDVALEDELRLSRHLEIAGDGFHEAHRLLAQEAGEQELVD
jgi:hypothetical protein